MSPIMLFPAIAVAFVAGCYTVPDLSQHEPVKVILDTDMISDYDDMGALACLHALADAGECEILATVSSTRGNASPGTSNTPPM